MEDDKKKMSFEDKIVHNTAAMSNNFLVLAQRIEMMLIKMDEVLNEVRIMHRDKMLMQDIKSKIMGN